MSDTPDTPEVDAELEPIEPGTIYPVDPNVVRGVEDDDDDDVVETRRRDRSE